MAGKRKLKPIKIRVDGFEVEPVKKAKYLGFWLDVKRSFMPHVKETLQKVERTVVAVRRIMPKTKAPRGAKRKMLASVARSIMFYAIVSWRRALKFKGLVVGIDKIQRRFAIGVSGAYRSLYLERQ